MSTVRTLGLTLALAALVAIPPAHADPAYNVLLISVDSLRRDGLGCYGAALPHAPALTPSPRLDAFAASGVRLTDAIALSPWTLPSHVTLFTGRSPVVHQVETDLNVLPAGETPLAELLRARGHRTAGVFSGPYLEPHWGFGRGFERYRAAYGEAVATASSEIDSIDREIARADAAGERVAAEELRWKRRKAYERVREVSHADVSSERVTAAALEDMDRLVETKAPWFLFVHYFDVHYDYVPPAPYDTRFDPRYAGSLTGRGFLTNSAIAVEDPTKLDGIVRRISDRDLEHVRALCAGEVASVDGHVGRLLDRLDAKKAADRTLVIVVSDHGDEFFEHGGVGHRRNLYEEVLRIPILMRLPGMLPPGRTVGTLTTLADVMPTVLDVLGMPPPSGITGKSVLPLLRGEEDGHGRSAVARLVRAYDATAHISGSGDVAVRIATVQEAFRFRGIKVFRRRQWPLYSPGLDEEKRRQLERAANEEFRKEEVAWVDLERSPNEAGAAFSKDFTDPRAHKALEMYRRRYRELSAARLGVALNTPDARMREQLESLGYVEKGQLAPMSPRDGFVLPPPGNVSAPAPR